MYQLVVEKGYEKGMAFPLNSGNNIIGRSLEADIQLKAPDVSRKHLLVHVAENEITAKPFTERTTLLDDVALTQEAVISCGQRLTLGHNTVIMFGVAAPQSEPDLSDEDLDEMQTQALSPPEEPDSTTPPASVDQSPREEAHVAATEAAPHSDPEDDDDEPLSGFIDVRADPGDTDEFQEPPSVAYASAGDLIKKDPGYTPPSEELPDREPEIEASSIMGSGESVDSEDGGYHTRGLSPEAVEHIRRAQEKKARTRRYVIIAIVVAAVILSAILIIRI